MADYRLSHAAQADIADILIWTDERFGQAARRRYGRLLVTSLRDIAHDPCRIGSTIRRDLGDSIRIYHLRHSRLNSRAEDGQVMRPRDTLHMTTDSPGV